jgi:hypothetical protein
MLDLDQSIRERAYHLWIAAGRPEGDSDAYWLEAQRELLSAAMLTPEAELTAETGIRKKSAAKAPAKPRRKAAA